MRAVLLLSLSILAAGCASFQSITPGAPASEVSALVGAPTSVWTNPDGSEVWEYPQGPLGTKTYMVTLGPDHRVRDVRQVLEESTISKLRVGMSRDQVRRMIGKPRDVAFSDRTDEEIWSWVYREWGARKMELDVRFDRPTGTVKEISRAQIDRPDDRRR